MNDSSATPPPQGFSDAWLALREPYDTAARSQAWATLGPFVRTVGGELRIVDLAAGTGANLRFLAPRLGGPQHWRLVDHDPGLHEAARTRLAAWSTGLGASVRTTGVGGLVIEAPAFLLRIDFIGRDLAAAGALSVIDDASLVTASALIDLVSSSWLDDCITRCAHSGADVAFALGCVGAAQWVPADDDDAEVIRAFGTHHHGDKGFGPALGPDAAKAAGTALRRAGYAVTEADSPWRIDATDRAMLRAMVIGHADAAAEMSDAPVRIGQWRDRRLAAIDAARLSLRVDHRDLWARAPG